MFLRFFFILIHCIFFIAVNTFGLPILSSVRVEESGQAWTVFFCYFIVVAFAISIFFSYTGMLFDKYIAKCLFLTKVKIRFFCAVFAFTSTGVAFYQFTSCFRPFNLYFLSFVFFILLESLVLLINKTHYYINEKFPKLLKGARVAEGGIARIRAKSYHLVQVAKNLIFKISHKHK